MTGCEIIYMNAFYSNGKPIEGLIDTPLDRLRTAVVNQAVNKSPIIMNWHERHLIAQNVILYPLTKQNTNYPACLNSGKCKSICAMCYDL